MTLVETNGSGPMTELDSEEAARLAKCELVIERGLQTFVEVGRALMEIRDSRLYRETHDTWEAYLSERWGQSRAYAHRQIEAAEVVAMLPNGNKPANEAQARALVPLRGDEKAVLAAMREAQAGAARHGGEVTAEHIRRAVVAIGRKTAGEAALARGDLEAAEELGVWPGKAQVLAQLTLPGLPAEAREPTLEELAEMANRKDGLGEQAEGAALLHYLDAGDALNAAKDRLEHGEWLPWVHKNFRRSEKTARNWMTLARNRQRIADSGETTATGALKLVGEWNAPTSDEAKQQMNAAWAGAGWSPHPISTIRLEDIPRALELSGDCPAWRSYRVARGFSPESSAVANWKARLAEAEAAASKRVQNVDAYIEKQRAECPPGSAEHAALTSALETLREVSPEAPE